MAVKQKSERAEYIKFSRELKGLHGWRCSICGLVNLENREKHKEKIVCHHILPVSNYGVSSPLLTNPRNIQVVCNRCHHEVCHGLSNYRRDEGARAGKFRSLQFNEKFNLMFKQSLLIKYGKK